jgi:anthranilate phosphoribosyltransferase
MRALLGGAKSPVRDIVLLNAAAVLVIADAAADLRTGVAQAAAAIDGGKASAALEALVEITNRSGA